MSRDIRESDWKVIRDLKPLALARYCERVLAEVVVLASDESVGSHDRYLAVFKLIDQRDGTLAHAFNGLSRSCALQKLTAMCALDLITEDELRLLSAEMRESVHLLLGR